MRVELNTKTAGEEEEVKWPPSRSLPLGITVLIYVTPSVYQIGVSRRVVLLPEWLGAAVFWRRN